jgi:hypothetical protein
MAIPYAIQDFVGKGAYSSVESLLDAFHNSATTADLDVYFGCFLEAESRFLGTDANENWTTKEFLEFAGPYFTKAKKAGKEAWTYILKQGTRKINIITVGGSEIAYFDELLSSESFKATTRGNGVAVRSTDGLWFLSQYHLSFPIPNPLAKNFCEVIAIFEAKEEEAGGGGEGGGGSEGDDAEKKLLELLMRRQMEEKKATAAAAAAATAGK